MSIGLDQFLFNDDPFEDHFGDHFGGDFFPDFFGTGSSGPSSSWSDPGGFEFDFQRRQREERERAERDLEAQAARQEAASAIQQELNEGLRAEADPKYRQELRESLRELQAPDAAEPSQWETSWQRAQRASAEAAERDAARAEREAESEARETDRRAQAASLERWLDRGRGRSEELHQAIESQDTSRQRAEAVGIDPDRAAEGPPGALESFWKQIEGIDRIGFAQIDPVAHGRTREEKEADLADLGWFSRQAFRGLNLFTGGQMNVPVARSATDEVAASQGDDRLRGFGDLAWLRADEDDHWSAKWAKAGATVIGDVAVSPFTYVGGGAGAAGRKAAAEVAEITLRNQAAGSVAKLSAKQKAGLANRIDDDILLRTIAQRGGVEASSLHGASRSQLLRFARKMGMEDELASMGFAFAGQEARMFGGRRLFGFLSETLGKAEAKRVWKELPIEVRGGVHWRVPFMRQKTIMGEDLGIGIPYSIALTPGGGQASRVVPGLDRLLDGGEFLRNMARTSRVGEAVLGNLGTHSQPYINFIARAINAQNDNSKEMGRAASTYTSIVKTTRQVANTNAEVVDNATAVAIGQVNRAGRAAVKGGMDSKTFNRHLREAFNNRGGWTDADLAAMTPGVRAAHEAATIYHGLLDNLWRQAEELGMNVHHVNEYVQRIVTEEAKRRFNLLKGPKKARGTSAFRRRTGVWAEWDLDPGTGNPVIRRWDSPAEIAQQTGEEIFKTNPHAAMADYTGAMGRAIREIRMMRRMQDAGVLPSESRSALKTFLDRGEQLAGMGAQARSEVQRAQQIVNRAVASGDTKQIRAALKQVSDMANEDLPPIEGASRLRVRRTSGYEVPDEVDDFTKASPSSLPDEIPGWERIEGGGWERRVGDFDIELKPDKNISGGYWLRIGETGEPSTALSLEVRATTRGVEVPYVFRGSEASPRSALAALRATEELADSLGSELFGTEIVNHKLFRTLRMRGWHQVDDPNFEAMDIAARSSGFSAREDQLVFDPITGEASNFFISHLRRPRKNEWSVQGADGKTLSRHASQEEALAHAQGQQVQEALRNENYNLIPMFEPSRIPTDPDEAHLFMEDTVLTIGRWLNMTPEESWDSIRGVEQIRTKYGRWLAERVQAGDLTELGDPAEARRMGFNERIVNWMEQEGVFAGPELAYSLSRMFQAYSDPSALKRVVDRVYQPWFTWWKTTATALSGPRFFVRNIQGGVFNAWLMGTSPRHYGLAAGVLRTRQSIKREVRKEMGAVNDPLLNREVDARFAARLRDKYGEERGDSIFRTWQAFEGQQMRARSHVLQVVDDPSRPDTFDYGNATMLRRSRGDAEEFGVDVVSSRHRGMAPHLEPHERGVLIEVGDWMATGNPVARRLLDATEGSETFLRLGAFMHGAEKFGLQDGGYAASLMVKASQFDYADLSDIEIRLLKRIFPFYTWARNNWPLQARGLVTQPGKSLRVMHANEALKDQFGVKPDGDGGNAVLPRWVREAQGWELEVTPGVAGREYPIAANLGWWPTVEVNQTFLAGHEGFVPGVRDQEILSQMSPLASVPVELLSGTRSFTRNRFPATEEAPMWSRVMPSSVTGRSKLASGEVITDPQRTHAFRSFLPPLAAMDRLVEPWARVLAQATGIKDVGEENRYVDRLITSTAVQAGLPLSTLDERQQLGELRRQSEDISREMRSVFGSRQQEAQELIRQMLSDGRTPEEVNEALKRVGLLK